LLRMRLSRRGKKRFATWRIVIADSRKAVTAKAVDDLGWYNPHTKEFTVDKEKVKDWFNKGAQPSNSLAILFEKNKIEMPSWVTIKRVEPKKADSEEVVEEKKEEIKKEVEVSDEKIEVEDAPTDDSEEVEDTAKEEKEEAPEA
jgi:small subunit ribosomal protein S16